MLEWDYQPAPWKLTGEGVVDDDGRLLFKSAFYGFDCRENTEATKALVSKAPEMAAKLEQAVDYLAMALHPSNASKQFVIDAETIVSEARELLKAAGGKEPGDE